MPNRILREGLLDSELLSKAGEAAEVLFTRLMLVVDDFGRFDGRVSVICRRCWPIGHPSDPSAVDVLERLVKLTENKLVVAYEVDGKPFIYIPKFKQRTRSSKSKFPDPPQDCPQAVSHLSDERPSNDSQVSAVGARSSSFVVRNSDSTHAHTRDPQPTRHSSHSIAKANRTIQEQQTWTASPMPESLKPHTRARETPLDSTPGNTEESKP